MSPIVPPISVMMTLGIRITSRLHDEVFDFVGNVRNDLNRLSEVFAFALFVKHIPVHFSSRQIGVLVKVFIDKAFIMPEIEVRLRGRRR